MMMDAKQQVFHRGVRMQQRRGLVALADLKNRKS